MQPCKLTSSNYVVNIYPWSRKKSEHRWLRNFNKTIRKTDSVLANKKRNSSIFGFSQIYAQWNCFFFNDVSNCANQHNMIITLPASIVFFLFYSKKTEISLGMRFTLVQRLMASYFSIDTYVAIFSCPSTCTTFTPIYLLWYSPSVYLAPSSQSQLHFVHQKESLAPITRDKAKIYSIPHDVSC